MSYEIVYLKQFIKAEKDNKTVFFPMIYGGSNNCIQFDRSSRGRRERSWFLMTHILEGKRFGTMEEMLKRADQEREGVIKRNKESNEHYRAEGNESWCSEYSDKSFGWFTSLAIGGSTSNTSFGKYKGLFSIGCKKALTVEELKEFRVNVRIHSYVYDDKKREAFEALGKKDINFIPQTSAELLEKLDEFDEYLKDTPYVFMYVTIDANESTMKRILREKFPTKKHVPEYKEVDKYFVMHIVNYGYFYDSKRYGFRYTPYQNSGKRFASQKAAERFQKRFAQKHSYTTVIETVNEKAKVKV